MTHLLFKTVDLPGFLKKTEIPAAPIPTGQDLTGEEEEEEKKEKEEQLRENLMTPQPDGWGTIRNAFSMRSVSYRFLYVFCTIFAPLGWLRTALASHLGGSGRLLDGSGPLLGGFWAALGSSWAALRRSWRLLVDFWAGWALADS